MKWVAPLGDEELDALDPAYGTGNLAYQAVGDFGGVSEEAGIQEHRQLLGSRGSLKVRAARSQGQGILSGLHKGAVEGGTDLKHNGALGSGLLAEIGGALDCSRRSGDDGLVRRVQVSG